MFFSFPRAAFGGDPSSEMDVFMEKVEKVEKPVHVGLKREPIVLVGTSGKHRSMYSQNARVELVNGEIGEMMYAPGKLVAKVNGERREIQATDIKRVLHD